METILTFAIVTIAIVTMWIVVWILMPRQERETGASHFIGNSYIVTYQGNLYFKIGNGLYKYDPKEEDLTQISEIF